MALSFIAPEIGVPIASGIGAIKTVFGDDAYNKTRSSFVWSAGVINGWSPVPPAIGLLPAKIAIFVVIMLVLVYAFGVGWGTAARAAYVGQALAIMVAFSAFTDLLLRWGIGA